MSWRDEAACLNKDQRIFFPQGAGRTDYAQARTLCGGCKVRKDCLDEALAVEGTPAFRVRGMALIQRHGMFGGLTPTERARIGTGTR